MCFIRVTRFLQLLAISCAVILSVIVAKKPWTLPIFFTSWGLWFTFATICLSQFFFPKGQLLEEDKNRYSPWRLWKFYIVLFEIAVSAELLITIYFWGVLYKQTDIAGIEDKLLKYTMMIIHSVPLFCLVIDDIFINSLGIVLKHYSAILAVTIAYLIVNMTVALTI